MGKPGSNFTVVSINLAALQAMLSDGTIVPIVALLDSNGEKTESTDDAIQFVTGSGDLWFRGWVESFEIGRHH